MWKAFTRPMWKLLTRYKIVHLLQTLNTAKWRENPSQQNTNLNNSGFETIQSYSK